MIWGQRATEIGMNQETSHSIPIVYRWHKLLWGLNKATLTYAMNEAGKKLMENEKNEKLEDEAVFRVVGQMAVAEMVE